MYSGMWGLMSLPSSSTAAASEPVEGDAPARKPGREGDARGGFGHGRGGAGHEERAKSYARSRSGLSRVRTDHGRGRHISNTRTVLSASLKDSPTLLADGRP